MPELAILTSVTGWGLAGILSGRAARKTTQLSLLFWGPWIALPLATVPLLAGASLQPPTPLLLFATASAAALFLAWGLFIAALQRGDTSPVVAIGSAYPLFALGIFVLAGTQAPTLVTVVGVLLVTGGLLVFQSLRLGGVSKEVLLLGLGSALLWGFWGFFDYKALQWGSAWDLMFWTLLFSFGLSLLLGVFLALRRRQDFAISRDSVIYRAGATLFSTIALLAFYWALGETSNPTAVISSTAAYPIVTMLIAVAVGEERFYPRRLLAIALIAIGVIALHI